MGLQHRMSLLPGDAEVVSEHLAVARQDGRITFFDASGPIFVCQRNDEGGPGQRPGPRQPRVVRGVPVAIRADCGGETS